MNLMMLVTCSATKKMARAAGSDADELKSSEKKKMEGKLGKLGNLTKI
jgi:hypothetical protein